MQIQQKNDYPNKTTSIPLSFTISTTSELQLQDSTKGDIVTPQEWIGRELARIRQDITPRHCPNHEGLLEVIDGMSKFLKQQVPQQQATFDEIVTAKRDRVIAKELLITQQQQQRPDNNNNNNNNNDNNVNNCNTCQQQNNSPIRGAPIEEMKFDDLANALVHVIQYSHRHILQNKNTNSNSSNTTSTQLNTPAKPLIPLRGNNNANNNDPHPVQLVRVFDDIRVLRDQDGGRIKDPLLAQQQLFSILFGHVQLTSQLYNPWQIICGWAKKLIYTRDWHKWMGFGLDAFIEAKNRSVTIDTLMYNSSSSPSNSSTTSSSSSSCGDDHHHNQNHSGQLIMEQLQALLQSINLVEKTFRA